MKPKNSFTIQDIALKTIMFNEKGVCPGNCYRGTEENPLTALPTGEHRILRHYCKQYQRYMPVILTAMSEEPRAMSQEKLTAHRSLLTARCEGCEPQKTEDKEVSINTPHLSSRPYRYKKNHKRISMSIANNSFQDLENIKLCNNKK